MRRSARRRLFIDDPHRWSSGLPAPTRRVPDVARSCYTSVMTGAELERAVAAILQTSGWFLVRGATDESFQAFELDVLGYRFTNGDESSVMVESKGGRSGFSDLWKVVGLKTHLGIDRGVLLADETEPLHDRKVNFAAKHDIVVVGQDATALGEELADAGVIEEEPDPVVIAAWQRIFRIEDALIKTLNDKDAWQRFETIKLAKKQLQHLASKAWLEPDPWRQAVRLYVLFQDEPKISRTMAREIAPGQSEYAYNEALYNGALPEVQACFYLEHRKRLAVAFAATRCAAHGDGSRWARLAPASFRTMVEQIRDERAWYLPAVLQVYFLGFGAMICLDDVDAEFREIAAQARCTPQEVEHALELFAELFWTRNGWFHERDELSLLKLVPVPIRGASIWMREAVYDDSWDALATEAQFDAVGAKHLKRASNAEATVLPRERRGFPRARRSRADR
jgi:hypothetical protein